MLLGRRGIEDGFEEGALEGDPLSDPSDLGYGRLPGAVSCERCDESCHVDVLLLDVTASVVTRSP